MSRMTHANAAPDLSALAKNLKRELDARAALPGHVELLNMLTRAVGLCRSKPCFCATLL